MEKLTYNQQDKLEHLCAVLDYTGTLDSKDKMNKVLAKFGGWESRYYETSLETIKEYVLDYLKKEWTMQYVLHADWRYKYETTEEERVGYGPLQWIVPLDFDLFDTVEEIKAQAIKNAINKAKFTKKQKEHNHGKTDV
jgi:hypothetical protein